MEQQKQKVSPFYHNKLDSLLERYSRRDTLRREYNDIQSIPVFLTPRPVAERMCEMAELDASSTVLEPSCGDGRLVDVIMEHSPASLFCVELNPDMLLKLKDKPYQVLQADFLSVGQENIGKFSRVIMNPPFTRFQNIDHIYHAYDLLDKGGILVSVVCESLFFRSEKKAVEFRTFLDRGEAEIYPSWGRCLPRKWN